MLCMCSLIEGYEGEGAAAALPHEPHPMLLCVDRFDEEGMLRTRGRRLAGKQGMLRACSQASRACLGHARRQADMLRTRGRRLAGKQGVLAGKQGMHASKQGMLRACSGHARRQAGHAQGTLAGKQMCSGHACR